MILAIISFAVEIIFMTATYTIKDKLSTTYAWFVIILMVACTITSLCCVVYNGNKMKKATGRKAPWVTGLVFSIVGASIGLIFCISCFAVMASTGK